MALILNADKFPFSRPLSGHGVAVWDEGGEYLGWGIAVERKESGIGIQLLADGRTLDSNHIVYWRYADEPTE